MRARILAVPTPHSPNAFTLIELLTTLALLVITLGLAISLSRHVRERAALALTKDVLRRLDQVMAQYAERHGGRLPVVASFPPPETSDRRAGVAAGGSDAGGRAA